MNDPLQNAAEELRRAAARRKQSLHRHFLQDAKEAILQARPYRLWKTILTQVRRLRMISFLFRLFGWLFTLLQTGTLVLLTTAIFFVILPLLLLAVMTLFFTALLDNRRSRKLLAARLKGKTVYVFFSASENFGAANVRAFAAVPNAAVLVVSPHWLSPRGLGSSRFFVNIRRENEHLFLIRRYFYFSVRKKLLSPDKTVLIY